MTLKQAQTEAVRRWGTSGAIRFKPTPVAQSHSGKGRLGRYCVVGNGHLGKRCSVEGQGDTWLAAFADARPIS
jgi:hypothetical protein